MGVKTATESSLFHNTTWGFAGIGGNLLPTNVGVGRCGGGGGGVGVGPLRDELADGYH